LEIFGNRIKIYSCNFHFANNVVSHVKSLGLKTDLSTNFNFGSWIYTLLGAVHLPHQYCVELWNYLLSDDEAPFINFNPNETFTQADEHYNVSLRRFINYFQNQWTMNQIRRT